MVDLQEEDQEPEEEVHRVQHIVISRFNYFVTHSLTQKPEERTITANMLVIGLSSGGNRTQFNPSIQHRSYTISPVLAGCVVVAFCPRTTIRGRQFILLFNRVDDGVAVPLVGKVDRGTISDVATAAAATA